MSKIIYNVEKFFQHTNATNAVSNTVDFYDYHNKLDKSGKARLEAFFHLITIRANVNISTITYKTDSGIEYVYVNAKFRSGVGQKFTIVCFPGFEKFREVLINNIVQIELNDLIKECESHNKEEN